MTSGWVALLVTKCRCSSKSWSSSRIVTLEMWCLQFWWSHVIFPSQVSFVICFAFFLAWSPYAVISMWSACGFQVPALTNVLASLFAKSASFYNPLIYMGMSSKFRKDVRNLFQCLNRDKDSALQMPVQMFNQRNEAAILLKPQREFVSKVPEAETPGLDMDSVPRDNPNPAFCSPVSNQLTTFGVKTIQRKQSGSGWFWSGEGEIRTIFFLWRLDCHSKQPLSLVLISLLIFHRCLQMFSCTISQWL